MPFSDLPSLTSPKFLYEVFPRSIENTNNFMVAETYIQLRTSFAQAAIGATSARNGGSYYLIEESPLEPVGLNQSPVVKFTRIFATIPAARYETARTQYSYPGKSIGSGATWLRYGLRRPITLEVNATDYFQYFYSVDGTGGPTIPALTVPKLSSEVVDFIGGAYDITPPYAFIATTSPSTEPTTYTVSNAIARWKGNIWVMITRTVPQPSAFI